MPMESSIIWPECPPEKLLRERFHISTDFHPGQREIIEQLVQGRRILAIQRTGWGKSLLFQITCLYYPHLTIVFSPLKALMRDQCQRCNAAYKLPSAILSSDFTTQENRETLTRAEAGELKILFVTPERLGSVSWQRIVSTLRISMIVIDEAHCISLWGHDFRPYYQRITDLIAPLPESTPVLALTATANKRVEEDILQQIGAARVIRGTMQRPNLYIHITRLCGDWEKLCYLASVLQGRSDTGIIYTATRHNAEMVSAFLNARDIPSEYYHAGREDSVRQRVEQELMKNIYHVVCSTNALGMGIDKSDLRFVIHYHIPSSLMHYYQEIGRAGRGGSTAWCILLYDPADTLIQEQLIESDRPKEKQYKAVWSQIAHNPIGVDEQTLLLKTGLSQTALRVILANLEEQHCITSNSIMHTYNVSPTLASIVMQDASFYPQLDFSRYETIHQQKLQELRDMQYYAQAMHCYMRYITAYMGDADVQNCGVCSTCRGENFPLVRPTERIQASVTHFLEQEHLPLIEAYTLNNIPVYEAGWSLSYHGTSHIGKLVALSKYENGGPFALSIVQRAVEIVRTRYPIHTLQAVVSVPSTSQGNMLVDLFARQVADMLGLTYLPILAKTRTTRKQKSLTNRVQKEENVKDAFFVQPTTIIADQVVLLIDDIYDSGYTLQESAKTLIQAGAKAVYPFTITRAYHSDNQ